MTMEKTPSMIKLSKAELKRIAKTATAITYNESIVNYSNSSDIRETPMNYEGLLKVLSEARRWTAEQYRDRIFVNIASGESFTIDLPKAKTWIHIDWNEFQRVPDTCYYLPYGRHTEFELEKEEAATAFVANLHFLGHHEVECYLVDDAGKRSGEAV
jgi:hypothetical protein